MVSRMEHTSAAQRALHGEVRYNATGTPTVTLSFRSMPSTRVTAALPRARSHRDPRRIRQIWTCSLILIQKHIAKSIRRCHRIYRPIWKAHPYSVRHLPCSCPRGVKMSVRHHQSVPSSAVRGGTEVLAGEGARCRYANRRRFRRWRGGKQGREKWCSRMVGGGRA